MYELLELITDQEWEQVETAFEKDPSLATSEVSTVFQGDNSKCLLVHLMCARRKTPLSIIEQIVSANRSALAQPTRESRKQSSFSYLPVVQRIHSRHCRVSARTEPASSVSCGLGRQASSPLCFHVRLSTSMEPNITSQSQGMFEGK
jgi:hypothetical protein